MANEGLKLVVSADVSQAEKALKGFASDASDTANIVAGDLASSFKQLKKQGVVSIGAVEDALNQMKEALKSATNPADINKLSHAIEFLGNEEKKLKAASLPGHLEGVTRSSNKAKNATIGFARVIGILPAEIGHLTHGFDSIIESFEKFKEQTGSTSGALKGLFGAIAAPIGIGLALSAAVPFIEKFGEKIFGVASKSEKEFDKVQEKIKELIKSTSEIKITAAAGTEGEAAKVRALAAVVLDQTAAYQERNRALNELKGINKNYFGDLSLEAGSLAKLTGLVNEYTAALIQQAVIKQFSEEIANVSVQISKQIPLMGKAGADVKKYERALVEADKANKSLISGGTGGANIAGVSTTAITNLNNAKNKFNDLGAGLNLLTGQSKDLRNALNAAVLESLKFKPLDDKGEAKKKVDDVIAQAKRLAAFLDRNTQFSVIFEVDETKSEAENKRAAIDFIAKAKRFVEQQTPEFKFKPLLRVDFNFIDFDKFSKAFKKQVEQQAPKTWDESKKAFEEVVKRAATSNPIVIETNLRIKLALEKAKQQAEFFKNSFSGFKLFDFPDNPTGPDGKPLFSDIQFNAMKAGAAINQTLTPAFQDLFAAIKSGENPLKAFFTGLGRSIEQLIEKIIAAAVVAEILSLALPGGIGGVKGFGGIFKKILGFADGGLVSGPQLALIGEGSGTNRSNPEVVAPLDQLRGMLAGLAPQQASNGVLTARIAGNDILLSNNRSGRQNKRLGA